MQNPPGHGTLEQNKTGGEGNGTRILATFALSFSGAVFAAVYGKLDTLLFPLAAALALAAPLSALVLGKLRSPRAGRRGALVCAGLALGFLWTGIYTRIFFQPAVELDGRTVELAATVADWPKEERYGWSVLVEADTASSVKLSAVLYTDKQGADLRPGDRISTVTRCTLGDRTFSGEPVTYYTAKGIFLRGEAYGELKVERPERVPVRLWPAVLSRGLKESIDGAFPAREAGLVRALVTGSRDNLTDQFTSSLERTGLSHTVAVSGMHLAFLASLLTLLLGRGKRTTAVFTMLWAALFCAIAGNTPSVLRAAMMILMLQAAPLVDRERDGCTSLGLALMLLLAWNPFSAAHVGLQLSFGAVAGILAVSDPVQRWLLEKCRLDKVPERWWGKCLRAPPCFVISTLSATLGASVFTIPLVGWHFGTLSLIAPLANVMTLWAVGILFVGGLLVGVAGLFTPVGAAALAGLFAPLARYLDRVVDLLSKPALAALSLDSFYVWAWIVLFYLLLLLAVKARGRLPLWLSLAVGGGTLVLAVALNAASFYTGPASAAVLDVGQGQSVLLRMGGQLTLVDCGGDSRDNPGDIAANYIQSAGRSRLDTLVLTHCHADHANGVPQLLNRLRVGRIVLPDMEPDSPLRREIVSQARARGTQLLFLEEDTRLELGSGGVLSLYAPVGEGGDTNELGLTVLASAGAFDVLITGDMGGEGERLLLARADLPEVELLVVGHHGSDTSTTPELLSAVRPQVAAISVGKNNRYGHPAPDTLYRLAAAGADIYRTDLNGNILARNG